MQEASMCLTVQQFQKRRTLRLVPHNHCVVLCFAFIVQVPVSKSVKSTRIILHRHLAPILLLGQTRHQEAGLLLGLQEKK